MIKVLSVSTFDVFGGAAHAAYRIHQGVRDLGVDSRMLVKYKKTNDVEVVALNDFVENKPFGKTFNWVSDKFRNKIQHFQWNHYSERDDVYMSDLRGTDLHGALQKLDYDVMHMHWINQRFIPLRSLPKDKPIVWTLHDSWPFCGICHYFFECDAYKQRCGCCPLLHSNKANDLSRQVWKKKAGIYKDLDLHIVTPSRWMGDCVKQSSLLGGFPVSVIPNCLDVETFRPLNDKEISSRWRNFQEKRFAKPFVLYGAMNAATDKIKGFQNLLSALRYLKQKGYGDDFELIVFGADESDVSFDVSIPIRYVGWVNDAKELASLYNLADVMVVPSLTENLSCAIMESMSCATPVVAFNIGGNGDMIEHKVNGYLAKEKDDADLAEGILWCLENNTDNCLGMAGREKVLRNYTYDAVCEKYKDLYERILQR